MSVDDSTRREINKIVERILRDSSLEPPIDINEILSFLKLHRDFYSLDEPGLLKKFAHRIQIGTNKAINVIRDKVKLAALWLPEETRILVDESQPKPKQLWASFHDTVHTVLPWHRDFFLGDTAQTLEPEYQDSLEEEANYGASALMFGGEQFSTAAVDTVPCWDSICELQRLHKKSYTTTFRRYIEHSHKIPLAGLISTPWWKRSADPNQTRLKHFVVSRQFLLGFPNISASTLLAMVRGNTRPTKFGSAGEFTFSLTNIRGESVEFIGEAFTNQHELMTLFVPTASRRSSH